MKFELEPYHRNVSDEDLMEELRRIARLLDKNSVTIDQFNEHSEFHSTTLSRRFGSWLNALEAAGLEKTRNLNIKTEELFENLTAVWLKLGRQPRYDDLTKDRSKFCTGTYENRFGTWRKALEAFAAWANEGTVYASNSKPQTSRKRRTPRTINWRLRALVLMRDGARCQYCGASVQHGAKLHIDHVVPWSKGGETTLDNLQVLCQACNVGKSDVLT